MNFRRDVALYVAKYIVIFLFLFFISSPAYALLVIDAGHGGYDPGATESGIYEKEINLKIAQKLASLLRSAGIEANLTRDGDVYLKLSERVEYTKKVGGDYFISIHQNWVSSPSVKGVEVYYCDSGDERAKKSKALADAVRKEIVKLTGQVDRGTRSANFYVLRENNVPAVLVECGFLSNDGERALLLKESFQWKIATGIFNGLVKYIYGSPFLIKSNKTFSVYDGKGVSLGTYSSGEVVGALRYRDFFFIYSTSGKTGISNSATLKFKSSDSGAIFEIVSYEDRPSWNPSLNDNKFRGSIELNYLSSTNDVWVVNELPIEDYVKGVAEQGNNNHTEYLKTMAVAQRTYALWHVNHGGKYPDMPYHLTNTSNDQVYKGYGYEKRAPNFVNAVKSTQGYVVTYQGNVAITPYSSGTDGRTRSWEEVWGSKNFPWCQSVPDPLGYKYLDSNGNPVWYTVGGATHGVGLSCAGARRFAGERGWNYVQILKYYFQGVEIKKLNTNKRIRIGIFKFKPLGLKILQEAKITSGDFNGDGKTDLAILYKYGSTKVGLWTFTSNGTSFTLKKPWSSSSWSWDRSKITSGDFNGDGKTDLAILYKYGSTKVGLWTFTSNGTSFTLKKPWSSSSWSWDRSKITSGDFNKDGKMDIQLALEEGYAETALWNLLAEDLAFYVRKVWSGNF
jgi:hypothetical protein